jgi:hypothetical protein
MPILPAEDTLFPAQLLDADWVDGQWDSTNPANWFCCVTMARAEKTLMNHLREKEIPFYCPMVMKRYRSPNGRLRASQLPLFSSYLFLWANEAQRVGALTSNKISKLMPVSEDGRLVEDLRRIKTAIALNIPLSAEDRLTAGDLVRVRSGPFAGYEGQVLRRDGKTRLVLSVRFIEQSVSLEIDQALLEIL